ncbi:MAG: hypothetical protein ACYC4L_07410 [Chloroflexota bacterium]
MIRRWVCLLLASALLASCAAATVAPAAQQGAPRAWLDAPLDGSTLAPGRAQLLAHASHLGGIAEVEFSADGAVLARLAPADPRLSLVTASQPWEATPGSHVLRVRARDIGGAWSEVAQAQVTVAGREVARAAPTATATKGATATAAPTRAPLPTATVAAAAATPTVEPAATSTAVPAAATALPPTHTATSTAVVAATHTAVPTHTPVPTATLTATPTRTATPRPPTATSTPVPKVSFGAPQVSASSFYWGVPGCGARTVTVSVPVSDPAGGTSVQLYLRLVDKSNSRAFTVWTALPMEPAGRGLWSEVVDPLTEIPHYSSYPNAWFQFYFVATNKTGPPTQSPTYSNLVTLGACIVK